MIANLYAFIFATAFAPNLVGAATTPRWALASFAVIHLRLGTLVFLGWCFYRLDFNAACLWAIVCGAFDLGRDGHNLRLRLGFDGTSIVRALAIGIGVSGLLAVFQKFFGFEVIPQAVAPAGLFLNKNVMGESAALVLILALRRRLWLSAIIVLPALILSGGKSATIAAMAGSLLLLPAVWRLAVLACLPLLLLFNWDLSSLDQRFVIWREALAHLSWLGAGSWTESQIIVGADYLHNDWLQSVYELGVVGMLPLLILFRAANNEAALVVTVLILGSFAFPLHMPFTAVVGAFFVGAALVNQSSLGRLALFGSRAPRRLVHST